MREFSIAGSKINRYFHVCAFFDSRTEQFDVLLPFYAEAISGGEKLINIVNPRYRADHINRLEAAGIDAHSCMQCGQLEVPDWDTVYLKDGYFDQDRMLALVDEVIADAKINGYSNIRLSGEMGWALADNPGSEQLIAYEARVNSVLERNRQPGVCIYDTAMLTGSMLMDVLRVHPLTLVGGVLHENPFYTEPEVLLSELASRQSASHKTAA